MVLTILVIPQPNSFLLRLKSEFGDSRSRMKLWSRFFQSKPERPNTDDTRSDLESVLFLAWEIMKRKERRILFEEHRKRWEAERDT